jgi:hypothetical protein
MGAWVLGCVLLISLPSTQFAYHLRRLYNDDWDFGGLGGWCIVSGYKLETTLNHVMSDIFDHSCDINIQSLAPSQDCTTLWDYLKGLSPALQVLSFDRRQLQLHCHNKSKMTKWFKVDPVEIGMFSTE